ncbi:MAG: hypothetical protein OXB88_01100, partial [Bacteriovoracales bacterium]|nr:hypothetical protein [Bacteriovoracales bacterium]
NKGKVTVLHPDKIGRRQRGATEACFLHVAGKRRGSRLPRLPGGEQLREKSAGTKILWYGKQSPTIESEDSTETRFKLNWQGVSLSFQTNIVGEYNIYNLSSVILYALHRGYEYPEIAKALTKIARVKRRQELKGFYKGCPFIDDFAHHPRAVQSTINAVRVSYPNKKLNVIFEPASATARSNLFQREFSESFKGADRIFIISSLRPSPLRRLKPMNWEQLKQDILQKGHEKVIVGNLLEEIFEFIEENARDGNLFLVLSNSSCLGFWTSDFVEKLDNA